MKTRREFLKTLAGSAAVLAACVVVPKSLLSNPEQETHELHEWEAGKPTQFEEIEYATSGYAQHGEPANHTHITTTTSSHTEGWTEAVDKAVYKVYLKKGVFNGGSS